MNLDKGKAPESMCGFSDCEKLEHETPLSARDHNSLELLGVGPSSPLPRMSSFQYIFDGLPDLHQQILSSSFDQPPPPPPPSSGELMQGEQSHQNRQRSTEKALRRCHSEEIDDESSGRKRRREHDHHHLSRKRTRSTEIHNKCEKRRRERLKEKVNTLRELIPHCDKDRASVLEDAIEYLKALKLREQALSASRAAFFQALYASPSGMPSTQIGFPTFVPMQPTAQAIPMAGLCRATALPTMPIAPAYLYPSLSEATVRGLYLNPANFRAAENFQATCFPSDPISVAPIAAMPLQTTSDASSSVSTIFNYTLNLGESSSRTSVNSSTGPRQVIPSSQDQTGVPQTQALQLAWSR